MDDSIDAIKENGEADFNREAGSFFDFLNSHQLATKVGTLAVGTALILSASSGSIPKNEQVTFKPSNPIVIEQDKLNTKQIDTIAEEIDAHGGVFLELYGDGSVGIWAHNTYNLLNPDDPFFFIRVEPGEKLVSLNSRILDMTGYHLEMIHFEQDDHDLNRLGVYVYPLNVREESDLLQVVQFALVQITVMKGRVIGVTNAYELTHMQAASFYDLLNDNISIQDPAVDFTFVDAGPIP